MRQSSSSTIIISGPTASGKTALSLKLARELGSAQLINADVGQLYTPLSIGTAKPDWQSQSHPHHGFDLISKPINISAQEWRSLVLEKQRMISQQGSTPIIVGGSFFYLKTLYFPLREELASCAKEWRDLPGETSELWRTLQEIDPSRAKEIHPNDRYRIVRALAIWEASGILPSQVTPRYAPDFNSIFIFLCPQPEVLKKSIVQRTQEMIEAGWIDEVRALMKTEWIPFLERKKLIGYPAIIEWIKNGEQPSTKDALIARIATDTWNYARRQIIFWRSFGATLTKNKNNSPFGCTVLELSRVDDQSIASIVSRITNHIKG